MAAVNGSLTLPRAQEARERLLASLHDAGIEPSSPLGLIMLAQGESVSLASAQFEHAAAALFEASEQARGELSDLHQKLARGVEQVESLQQAGESRIRSQEIFLEREQTAAVARVVKGIEQALAENAVKQQADLYTALKKRLPQDELAFYRQVRWNRMFIAFVLASALIVLGYWSGGRATSANAVRGKFCTEHLQYDKATGMLWCPLTLPPENGGHASP